MTDLDFVDRRCFLPSVPDNPADKQGRAQGDGSGIQDGQSRRHRCPEQRFCGLRVQDVRSHPGKA